MYNTKSSLDYIHLYSNAVVKLQYLRFFFPTKAKVPKACKNHKATLVL